jgi:signal transduction histidine kinase
VVLLGFFKDPDIGASSFKIGLANLLAHLIGTKLTGIKLQRTLTKQAARLNKLVASAVQALKAEREWMRIEVHDSITKNMLSTFQHLDTCEGALGGTTQEVRGWIHRARTQVREAVRQSRELINDIRIAPVSELDFAATIRKELGNLQQETGCQVELYAADVRIPSDIGLVLYRIAHEAITNVQRHASSPRLLVKLTHKNEVVTLTIKDWGAGFEIAAVGCGDRPSAY